MDWQDLVALAIVAAAAAYLTRKFWLRRTGGCAGCGVKESCARTRAAPVELKIGPFRPDNCPSGSATASSTSGVAPAQREGCD